MVLRCSGCSPVHVIFGDFVVTVHSFGFPSLIFFALQYNTYERCSSSWFEMIAEFNRLSHD